MIRPKLNIKGVAHIMSFLMSSPVRAMLGIQQRSRQLNSCFHRRDMFPKWDSPEGSGNAEVTMALREEVHIRVIKATMGNRGESSGST